jgi:hypothetical protein
MINFKPRTILLICIIAIPSVAVFGWMSYKQTRTEFMKTTVRQAFDKEITALSPQWSRIEVHSDAEIYYSPIVDANQTLELYRYVLEDLNQDASLPPVKMNPPAITKDFGPSEDSLTCQVTIEFPLILGIDRKVMMYGTITIPHYTTPK